MKARHRAPGVALLALLAAASAVGQDSSGTAESDSALIEAYQREFVFLNNEIRLLEQRLQEVETDGESRVAAARARLQRLEEELILLGSDVDRRLDELRLVEEQEIEAADAGGAIENILVQATARLRNGGRQSFREAGLASDDPAEDQRADELDYVLTEAFSLLRESGSIRTEDSQFFLDTGEQVDGRVVRIGQVAALGVSDSAGGTLSPAGGGRFRLADPSTADVARSLAEGSRDMVTIPAYVYESLDELVETDTGSSLRDTIEGGGIIGLVILALGALAVVLIILRVLSLRSVAPKTEGLDAIYAAAGRRDLDNALILAQKVDGAMGRVLVATIQGLKTDPDKIEDVISEAVLNENPAIDRFRSTISVFAAVAPLLGLLGTVTGMIATFDIITQFGTGDPRLLSGGISEALITTEFGLIVAIPTLLVGNLLSSWGDRITSNLEMAALRVVNAVSGQPSVA